MQRLPFYKSKAIGRDQILKTKEKDFLPVLLGSDINTYSMARAFYEEYGVKSTVIGKINSGPSCNSTIIDFFSYRNLDRRDDFLKIINNLAEKHKTKKILLMGCGDSYVELIIKNRPFLRENIITPYVGEKLMQALLTKEEFYRMCDKYKIDYPGTFIYSGEMGEDIKLPFGFPVIVKPSNGINYWENDFETQKKVYKLDSMSELKLVINQIYTAGYSDKLIIQDFIPGDDSFMRVMICFSGRDKKVKLMSLGHVMLEEHTPHGLGNTAALMNEYNEELSLNLKGFLEDVGYEGFSTFDIKYDQRDGKYKIFEVNLRQGRSNYYVTGAGDNLARYVTEEYIYGKTQDFKIAQTENLWTVIPMQVAYKYVKDKALIDKMKQLIRDKRVVNPLFLKGDCSLKRRAYLYKSHMSHFIKFRKYYK